MYVGQGNLVGLLLDSVLVSEPPSLMIYGGNVGQSLILVGQTQSTKALTPTTSLGRVHQLIISWTAVRGSICIEFIFQTKMLIVS